MWYACDGKCWRCLCATRSERSVLRYLHKCLHAGQPIDRKAGGAGPGLPDGQRLTAVTFQAAGTATEALCLSISRRRSSRSNAPIVQLDARHRRATVSRRFPAASGSGLPTVVAIIALLTCSRPGVATMPGGAPVTGRGGRDGGARLGADRRRRRDRRHRGGLDAAHPELARAWQAGVDRVPAHRLPRGHRAPRRPRRGQRQAPGPAARGLRRAGPCALRLDAAGRRDPGDRAARDGRPHVHAGRRVRRAQPGPALHADHAQARAARDRAVHARPRRSRRPRRHRAGEGRRPRRGRDPAHRGDPRRYGRGRRGAALHGCRAAVRLHARAGDLRRRVHRSGPRPDRAHRDVAAETRSRSSTRGHRGRGKPCNRADRARSWSKPARARSRCPDTTPHAQGDRDRHAGRVLAS